MKTGIKLDVNESRDRITRSARLYKADNTTIKMPISPSTFVSVIRKEEHRTGLLKYSPTSRSHFLQKSRQCLFSILFLSEYYYFFNGCRRGNTSKSLRACTICKLILYVYFFVNEWKSLQTDTYTDRIFITSNGCNKQRKKRPFNFNNKVVSSTMNHSLFE